ncbi:hypothetical protein ACCAA_1110002 [Candidatus Accumulibacter aalborgensis]|uniref:Uncharacterized protein n=1 Tax=Candidatus Accumulibacter aalborgensis TaxID=1860102 RepID=A0A1A8XG67_9PROT|nr:hypothetical protein ACCAA_1110002 [Candidatus Accumulibacter aalborgensis]
MRHPDGEKAVTGEAKACRSNVPVCRQVVSVSLRALANRLLARLTGRRPSVGGFSRSAQ